MQSQGLESAGVRSGSCWYWLLLGPLAPFPTALLILVLAQFTFQNSFIQCTFTYPKTSLGAVVREACTYHIYRTRDIG